MSNQTLTRAEVTDAIVREVGVTRQESSDLLDRTLDMIGSALEHEDEAVIAPRRVVTFRPSPMLKARVDKG